MITEVIPLGTASATPAAGRHLSATALRREGRVLLFDCGEGTQYRLLEADLNRARVDAIFVTHFHGDHFYGLMGLISTMAILGRSDPLTVVGPARIEAILRSLPGLANDWLPFETRFVELAEDFDHSVVYEVPGFTVEARPLDHRVFCVGYRFEERDRPGHLYPEKAEALGVTDYAHFRALKAGEPVTLPDGRTVEPGEVVGPARPGISFAYVADTVPCAGGRALAREADLLYHEATFTEELADRADETGHSTARGAATVARDARAQRLLLGHFSARYGDPSPLVDEARAVFENTEAAQELKRYALDPRDKEPGA